LKYLWERGVLASGDKITYLRMKGVKIGKSCRVLPGVGSFGSEPYLVEIGNEVRLADGVTFLTHDGGTILFRSRLPGMNAKYGNLFGKITIRDNCVIGYGSIILPGVTIGPDSIVGAGSVVARDVPPTSVAAGNPARVLCTLDEYIAKCYRRMLPLEAQDRASLREELLTLLEGSSSRNPADVQLGADRTPPSS
jgi:acetyltransferase-like isoleucine patch superfamily enzyme